MSFTAEERKSYKRNSRREFILGARITGRFLGVNIDKDNLSGCCWAYYTGDYGITGMGEGMLYQICANDYLEAAKLKIQFYFSYDTVSKISSRIYNWYSKIWTSWIYYTATS